MPPPVPRNYWLMPARNGNLGSLKIDRLSSEHLHRRVVSGRQTISAKRTGAPPVETGKAMLMLIFAILLVLWLLGMVSSYTLGGYLHILLIIAIAVLLIRIIQGRRPI